MDEAPTMTLGLWSAFVERDGISEMVRRGAAPKEWAEWGVAEHRAINGDVEALRRLFELYEAERVRQYGWPLREAC